MNISDSYAATRMSMHQSILQAANRQPELALELITRTAESLQSGGETAMKSPASPVSASPSSPSPVGQSIDIKV